LSSARLDPRLPATISPIRDRCVVRWIYHWIRDGEPGHVRGVDVFRLRDGPIAEKLSTVKD
jgi:hypothetical protein